MPLRLRGRGGEIQDLYLDGHKRDAAAAVPDAFVDEVALVGAEARLAERLDAWRETGATTLLLGAAARGAAGAGRADRLREALAQALGTTVTRTAQLAGGA